MRLLFSGLQKECLRLGYLLLQAGEHFQLHPSVMVPLWFPGLAVGDVLSGAYFLFEVHFFLRSTYTHVGRMLLQQRGVDYNFSPTSCPSLSTLPFLNQLGFQ